MVVSSQPLMKENLYRRLDILEEERLSAGPPRILDVVFVKPDGTRAPRGLQVLFPRAAQRNNNRRRGTLRREWSQSRGR